MRKKLFNLSAPGAVTVRENSLSIKETSLKDIAIIGIGVRLAGYDDIESFENDLFEARDRVCPLSGQRKEDADAMLRFSGKNPENENYLEMAYLDRIDRFDHRAFKISPSEARIMAPDQRLFLETAARALWDAGYGGDALAGARMGVFLGAGNERTYARMAARALPGRMEQIFLSNVPSNLAGRISFLMDWQGPAMMVDTACSSSLVAVHAACRALRAHECDLALVGAAKVNVLPCHVADFQIQSADGRTRAFDDAASGTGAGEGVFAVLLRPLEKALKHEDPVYAVIKGSALNQDGHSAGLTIPSAPAQTALICSAWADAGIDPETVRFIEAHGTGTRLGDPVEVQGITRAFEKYTTRKGFCALGTIKGNFGHLDNAAGIAGLVKAAVCLRRGSFPGLAHFTSPHSGIDFDSTPVFPARIPVDLNRDKGPVRGGVSAFGLSGINCHMVLEAAPLPGPRPLASPDNALFSSVRHWLDLAGTGSQKESPSLNPARQESLGMVIQKRLARTPDQAIYAFGLASEAAWLLEEHQVDRTAVFPAAAWFQTVFEAARQESPVRFPVIENLFFQHPLVARSGPDRPESDRLEPGGPEEECPVIMVKGGGEGFSFEAAARDSRGQWQTYVSATWTWEAPSGLPALDIAGLKSRLVPCREVRLLKDDLEGTRRVTASDRWKCLKAAWEKEGEFLGELELPEIFQGDLDHFFVHPALLDAAISFFLKTSGGLPMGCLRARFFDRLPQAVYSHIRLKTGQEGPIATCDITLADLNGKVLACFDAFSFKRFSAPFTLLQRTWQPAESSDTLPLSPDRIMVLGGRNCFPGCVNREIPEEAGAMERLLSDMEIKGTRVLVFAPGVFLRPCALSLESLDQRMGDTVLALFRLARLLAGQSLPRGLSLLILGRGAFALPEDRGDLIPENAALEGLAKVVGQELKSVSVQYLDLDLDGDLDLDSQDGDLDLQQMVCGVFSVDGASPFQVMAMRRGRWYVPDLGPSDGEFPLVVPEDESVWLITGGMGGMGLALASLVFERCRARLVLVGRTPLPRRHLWDQALQENGVSAKLKTAMEKIQALEDKGARVLTFSADVSDKDAMEKVLEKVRARWGRIDGVVHCAGIAGDGFLFRKKEAVFQEVLAPKVQGTVVLDLLTRQDGPSFFILCSALTALTGAPGQGDYTAANAFMDAFSFYRNQRGEKTLSINWPAWKESGMAVDHGVAMPLGALSNAEGQAVFEGLLAFDRAQAIVDPGAGQEREEKNVAQALDDTPELDGPPELAGDHETRNHDASEKGRSPEERSAPEDVKAEVAGAWCKVLGYDRISRDADFFDLGGDSISAMEINNILSKIYGIDIPIDTVFSHGTLEAFTKEIQNRIPQVSQKLSDLPKVPDQPFYPASPSQKRLFLLQDIVGDSTGYNLPLLFECSMAPDPVRLEQAFQGLVLRHEPLRTVYRIEDNAVVQVIMADVGFHIEETTIEKADVDAQIRGFSRRFDLSKAPLLRAGLLHVSDGRHLLIFDVHHIAADALSLEILCRELLALYDGRDLPALAATYKVYSLWQQEQALQPSYGKARAYYLEMFQGRLPVLDMKTDFPRPKAMTFEGDVVEFQVEPALFARVKAFAARLDTTPFVVFLSTLCMALHKAAAQEDIIVAIADNGRDRPEFAGLVGMFINYLALRTFPAKNKPALDFVGEVKEAVVKGFRHKSFPFDALVRELDLPRDLSRNPLTGVTFSYMHFNPEEEALPTPLELKPCPTQLKDSSKFDMAFFATVHDTRVHFALEYYGAVYTRERMAGFCQSYLALLAHLLDTPEQTIARLAFIPSRERERILTQFCGAPSFYPAEKNLVALFAEQVEKTPDRPAVISRDCQMTYQELRARALLLSSALEETYGVRQGDFVALLTDEAQALAPAVLGILGAGCAYVPLDKTFPEKRIRYILKDTRSRVLVTDAAHKTRLATRFPEVAVVSATEISQAAGGFAPKVSLPDVTGQDIAYVMYTSGTTGEPKGVLIRHRSIARLVINTNYIRIIPSDRILKTGTISFDASTFEIWGALLNGAALCIPEEKTILDLNALRHCLGQWKITVLWLTASLFNILVDLDRETRGALFKDVRAVLTGGEKMSRYHAEEFLKAYPEIALINGYGPTENTTFTCCHQVTSPEGEIPIGSPVANTSVYILDSGMNPVPIGVPGMIHAGGDGVAKGYLGLPALTRKVFVPNPFIPGDILYNTGDLGCWRSDGSIAYLGRKDTQVKIRGFRIEPAEIENALLRHPGIGRVAVQVRTSRKGEELYLAAYFTARENLTEKEVAAFLREQLPEYMVPSSFTRLSTLPLTVNGKTDYAALPEPAEGPAPEPMEAPAGEEGIRSADIAPEKALVRNVIAGIWGRVLGRDPVSAQDDFFLLGGHSLTATRVMSGVNQAFSTGLSVKILFETPVFEAFCLRIAAALQEKSIVFPITALEEQEDYPLSFAQERLWFLDRLITGNPFYNVPLVLKMKGSLDIPALERAIHEIVRRHEPLRTCFVKKGETPVQKVMPDAAIPLPLENLEALALHEKEAALAKGLARETQAPFVLSQAPMIRTKLFRLEEQVHLFSCVIHHIAADGWSLGVLSRELTNLYRAFVSGEAHHLPEIQIHYRDFAQWQRGFLMGSSLERQRQYWLKTLDGFEELSLPSDRPRPEIPAFTGDNVVVDMGPEMVEKLHRTMKKSGCSLFMILMAAFAGLLSRYSGQEDIVAGTAIANRNRKEIEPLIGFFVNTLVLRFDFTGRPTVKAFLQQVRQITLDAYANQDFPFEKLVEALVPERQIAGYPITQVNLTVQNMPFPELSLPGLTLEGVPTPDATVRFDLEIDFWQTGDRIHGNFRYSTELFNRVFMERMTAHFTVLLDAMLENPQGEMASLPMLTPGEIRAIQRFSQSREPGIEVQGLIPALFRERAAAEPDRSALICGDRRLTFGELDERSDGLAEALAAAGAGPGTRVGFCMNRSVEAVAAILAVFKVGAVWVPMDPAYPAERMAYIIRDSGMGFMVPDDALVSQGLFQGQELVFVSPRDRGGPLVAGRGGKVLEGDAPAYVIYTSGSTGAPKGVVVTGESIARHCLNAARTYGMTRDDRVLHFASFSFDVSLELLFAPLLAGACLVLREEGLPTPGETMERIEKYRITVADLPPAYLVQVLKTGLASGTQSLESLRLVIAGGEAMTEELFHLWRRTISPHARLVNAYGPTEATVTALTWDVPLAPDRLFRGMVPIGRPLPGRVAHVVDRNLQPLPPGLPGELLLGGDGIAQGYLNRPDLTKEKFIQSPFPQDGDMRVYRTGDLVQWLDDGRMAFLGRMDNQVKIRGFRIEPGEIEACMARHPAVEQAVVQVRESAAGEKQLVGYLVPGSGEPETPVEGSDREKELLAWHKTVQDLYTDLEAADPGFNISGWNSGITGKPFPAHEMKAWVEQTVEQILGLDPEHVLEIGCGTGLLLSRIAPVCKTYVGIDFSKTSLKAVEQLIKTRKDMGHACVYEKEAADLDGFALASFDTVIINSVIQYFPNAQYLERVMAGALDLLKPGGRLFIGDVRNRKLQQEFYLAVEEFKQGKETDPANVAARVAQAAIGEEELFVDPEFFYAFKEKFSGVGHVTSRPKPGTYCNELSLYRYDVVMYKQADFPRPTAVPDRIETAFDLEAVVQSHPDMVVKILSIPNARNSADRERVERMEKSLAQDQGPWVPEETAKDLLQGIAPEEIDQVCRNLSVKPQFHLTGKCHFDLVLVPEDMVPRVGHSSTTPGKREGDPDLSCFTNRPAMGIFMKRLLPEVREFVSARLPAHMVPQFLVPLESFPLLASGKIDKNALPDPLSTDIRSGAEFVAPVTKLERQLARIWQDILGISRIGVHDDFFLMGGQSLLAVSLVSRINQELEQDLPLSVLFRKKTIHEMARFMETGTETWSPVVPIRATGKEIPLFCFYPAGGNIYSYSELAHALDLDIPFYALQAVGLERGQTPIPGVQAMADYYMDWICRVQPQGPYRLAGWSFGGLVAFEAAQKLKARGEAIDLLALFDSSAKNSDDMRKLNMEDNALFLSALLAEYVHLDPGEMAGMPEEEQIRIVLQRAEEQGVMGAGIPLDQGIRLLNVFKNNGRAALDYRPGPYDGEILLFKPMEKSLSAFQYTRTETQGWETVCSRVVVHRVPGKHETMLSLPHVRTLAAILNPILLKGACPVKDL